MNNNQPQVCSTCKGWGECTCQIMCGISPDARPKAGQSYFELMISFVNAVKRMVTQGCGSDNIYSAISRIKECCLKNREEFQDEQKQIREIVTALRNIFNPEEIEIIAFIKSEFASVLQEP